MPAKFFTEGIMVGEKLKADRFAYFGEAGQPFRSNPDSAHPLIRA
jgi:hypothetical protein